MLIWEYSLMIIKWDWGKFFLKVGKCLTPTIKNEKVIYSNSSPKLWIDRKYAINLIPVKSYKKGFVFLWTMTLKDITNQSLKLVKVFSQISFKVNTLLYSNASQYSGAKQIRKTLRY